MRYCKQSALVGIFNEIALNNKNVRFRLQNLTKVNVNNVDINYLKVGNGPHTLLLLPGAMGRRLLLHDANKSRQSHTYAV